MPYVLAYRGRRVVGRIAGILHKGVNEKNNVKQLRFTRFDTIDDFAVTKALFKQLVLWAKELGMEEIIGPMSFPTLTKRGCLSKVSTAKAPIRKYTITNITCTICSVWALIKWLDWNCYIIKVPEQRDERISRVAEYVKKRNGYEVADVYALAKSKDKSKLRALMMSCLDVMNDAFEDLYGTSPLSESSKNAK